MCYCVCGCKVVGNDNNLIYLHWACNFSLFSVLYCFSICCYCFSCNFYRHCFLLFLSSYVVERNVITACVYCFNIVCVIMLINIWQAYNHIPLYNNLLLTLSLSHSRPFLFPPRILPFSLESFKYFVWICVCLFIILLIMIIGERKSNNKKKCLNLCGLK